MQWRQGGKRGENALKKTFIRIKLFLIFNELFPQGREEQKLLMGRKILVEDLEGIFHGPSLEAEWEQSQIYPRENTRFVRNTTKSKREERCKDMFH